MHAVNKYLSPVGSTAGKDVTTNIQATLATNRFSNRAVVLAKAMLAAIPVFLATAAGAISVGPSGSGVITFSSVPAPSDWATMAIAGGGATYTDFTGLNAGVQALSASSVANQLPTATTVPPTTDAGGFRWNSSGLYIQSRPTGNGANVLKATLQNDTMGSALSLIVTYDFAAQNVVTGELPGLYAYYSLSGSPNTWVYIPELSASEANGTVSATLNLSSTPWGVGSTMYLLWIDDNANGPTDPSYTIDNVSINALTTNLPLAIALTAPANGQHFGLGTTISARVALAGSPTNVSYYVDDALVLARTSAPFTPAALPAQALGQHSIYATARDTNDTFVTTATNTFIVDLSYSGTLSSNTTFYASNSPYLVDGNLTIAAGATLTIEGGTTLQLGPGVRVIVNGCIQAVGSTDHRIRFTRASSNWGGFTINANHQSNVFAYVDFEYGASGGSFFSVNDGQLTLERDTFMRMSRANPNYLNAYYPQVTIRHSVFDDVGGNNMFNLENMHADGWLIVDGNLFGLDTGDTDVFHLNHISVKGGPRATILNNVFTGAGDDHIDDNESDSHIEGNLFLNYTTNHPPRSASAALTTGEGSGSPDNLHTQRLMVMRNIFWGCDYGIINKDGSAVEIYNCVFVNNRGGIIFDEPWRTDSGPGRACYIESSIFWNNWPDNGVEQGTFAYLTNSSAYVSGRYYRGATQVEVNNSILPAQYHYLGTGNTDADPKFTWPTNLMSLSPTNPAFANGFDGFDANSFLFTNGFIPDVHLLAGSPAIGTGFNGTDMGIYVSEGATISGEPPSVTSDTSATLTIGGLDLYGYRYRLIGSTFTNAWSLELQAQKYVYSNSIAGTTARAYCTSHGYSNGDTVEVKGADSLCPYYNGIFSIFNVTANTFDYTVTPGTNLITSEPLSITWPRGNEHATDIWCRRLQNIQLTGLADGTYRVEAIRKNSMDVWQSTDAPTVSKSWTVGNPNFRITGIRVETNTAILTFQAEADKTYSILASDTLVPANWNIKVADIPAPGVSGPKEVLDPGVNSRKMRYYKMVTPAQ